MENPVITEHCTLYLGDCLDVLPTLGKVDAVVTDPPYGIGADKAATARGGVKRGKAWAASKVYAATDWDASPVSSELLNSIISAARMSIVFGGNYFHLPPSKCWLVWDKETGDNFYADAELAWTNLDRPVRLKRYMWKGMLRANNEQRGDHPTQKPLGVMRWCLEQIPDAGVILDPFMGSGTTGVACIRTGRKFIGIEKEPKYFKIAVKRIREAERLAKCDLFKEPKLPKLTQRELVS